MSLTGESYSVADAVRDLTAIADKQADGATDWEDHHEDADEILLRLINHADVQAAYERIGKWYA